MTTAPVAPRLDRAQTLTFTDFTFAAGDADGALSGTAATYSRDVDRGWGLVLCLEPGCFADSLKDPARVKLLHQHEWENPIGRVTELTDTEQRLRFAGQVLAHEDRPVARKALADLRDGLVDELSVGFRMLAWKLEEEKTEDGKRVYRYRITKAHLQEISVVTFGAMAADARVDHVNSGVHPDQAANLLRADRLRAAMARRRVEQLRRDQARRHA